MSNLNEKQEKFCKEYVVDYNATQAAIRAGYSEDSAGAQSHKLLKKAEIQLTISKLQNKASKRLEINQDMVIMEIANIAFADIGLICDWDDEGNLVLKDREKMGTAIKAVNAIQAQKYYDKDGNHTSTKLQFRMNDKLKALELLSKHLGLLDGNGSGTGDTSNVKEQLRGAVKRLTGPESN